jgi:hypothetical protein
MKSVLVLFCWILIMMKIQEFIVDDETLVKVGNQSA